MRRYETVFSDEFGAVNEGARPAGADPSGTGAPAGPAR
jgi:hypothetical protein